MPTSRRQRVSPGALRASPSRTRRQRSRACHSLQRTAQSATRHVRSPRKGRAPPAERSLPRFKSPLSKSARLERLGPPNPWTGAHGRLSKGLARPSRRGTARPRSPSYIARVAMTPGTEAPPAAALPQLDLLPARGEAAELHRRRLISIVVPLLNEGATLQEL